MPGTPPSYWPRGGGRAPRGSVRVRWNRLRGLGLVLGDSRRAEESGAVLWSRCCQAFAGYVAQDARRTDEARLHF